MAGPGRRRLWILPKPNGKISAADRMHLAVGITLLSDEAVIVIPPYLEPAAGGGVSVSKHPTYAGYIEFQHLRKSRLVEGSPVSSKKVHAIGDLYESALKSAQNIEIPGLPYVEPGALLGVTPKEEDAPGSEIQKKRKAQAIYNELQRRREIQARRQREEEALLFILLAA